MNCVPVSHSHIGVQNPAAASSSWVFDLTDIGFGLESVKLDIQPNGPQVHEVVAFIEHCKQHGTARASSPEEFTESIGEVIRQLLTGRYGRDPIIGALALKRAPLTGLDGLLNPPDLNEGENWAHYLARHGQEIDESNAPPGQQVTNLVERFKLLDAAGMPPGLPKSGIPSPLSVAVAAGNLHSLNAMLALNPLVWPALNGDHLLHEAVRHAGLQIQLALILAQSRQLDVFDSCGRTPIHLAVERGDQASIQLLVSNGANPNLGDNRGDTPLHTALVSGAAQDLVQCLLNLGANPLHVNAAGLSPLVLAIEADNEALANIFLSYIAIKAVAQPSNVDIGQLSAAAGSAIRRGKPSPLASINAVVQRIKSGVPVASQPRNLVLPNADTSSLMHLAVTQGQLELISWLLDLGYSVDFLMPSGLTLLLLALEAKQVQAFDLLLARGADCNKGVSPEMSIWVRLAMQGEEEMLRSLIAHGRRPSLSQLQQAWGVARQLGHQKIQLLLCALGQTPGPNTASPPSNHAPPAMPAPRSR